MAWFIPSFNRPQQCGDLLHQIGTVGSDYPGFVLVNGGERETEYRAIFKQYLPKHWDFAVIKDNIGCVQSANWYFEHYPNDPFYGFISDDESVHTPGWEKMLIDAAGDWRLSNANDGWQSEQRFHGLTTFGGELIRLIGWWGLKGLWHWYGENVWEQINKDFHLRVFCDEVICEHRHHLVRRAAYDDTYKSGESRMDQDNERFNQWISSEYPALKARLRAGIPADILAAAKSA
jgi:hypothetical protein